MKKYSDKIQHFIVAASIVIVITWLLDRFIPGYYSQAVYVGAFVSALWGVWKENQDSKKIGNEFDWWDILADVAGIVLAVWLL